MWPAILQDAARGQLQPFYRGDRSRPLDGLVPDRRIFKGKNYLPVALVETSRGCPFQCNFCSIGAVFQGSYRRRPVQEIVGELRQVHDKYVFFVDDNIVGDPAGARELFEAIVPLRIQWMSQGSLHALRDEVARAPDGQERLHGIAGRLRVAEPPESRGDGQAHQPGGRIPRCAGLPAAGRRFCLWNFYFWLSPFDTTESFEESVRFAKKENLFLAAFNHLVPFPGTPLYRELAATGRLQYPQWWLHEDYRFGQVPFHPAAMEAIEIEENCHRARSSFYTWGSNPAPQP